MGAIYLPHEASDYYHEDIFEHLTDDIMTIKAKYQVPIVLLGDFNSRVGLKNDVEYDLDDEEFCIDENKCFCTNLRPDFFILWFTDYFNQKCNG